MRDQTPVIQDKADFVRKLFNSIAYRYDAMNLVMTGGLFSYWQRVFLHYTGFQPGQRVLDVCTGTAGLALLLARQVQPGGQVVGIDFSEDMLTVGRAKVERSPYRDAVELVPGDAMDLPFADDTFDGATIGFALRNVADISRTLSEMRRVVKAGGRVLSLELSHPRHPLVGVPYGLYFGKVVPWLGRLNEKGFSWGGGLRPYTYLPLSLQNFPRQDKLAELFRLAGLERVGYRELTGGIVSIHYASKPSNEVKT
ncbi:MAG: class I SAM-dependent methyltransferase [Firmicutes bacterium]|nr:class I SAM-dependent methyltransferase [Bacillota bacterium]MCL5039446.1 class I SAM-dependent methyltransferase [Bacillota bacterium]